MNTLNPHFNPNVRLRLDDLEKFPRSLPCLMGWKDRESRYLGITDYMLEYSGLGERDELLYRSDHEIKRFENFADYFVRCDQFAMSGKPLQTVEKTLNSKNELITINAVKYPVYDSAFDKVEGVFFFGVPVENPANATPVISQLLSAPSVPIMLSGTHYIFELSTRKVALTKKESSVLYYYLRGRTSKQIASVLHLSYRTVEDYINTIKSKLLCNLRSDVIDLVIFSGLFDFVPDSLLKT